MENNPGPSRRSQLELDTKGCCFLCLKPVIGDGASMDRSAGSQRREGEMGEVFSLYQLSRYLSIDMGQVLKRLTGPLLAAIPNEASLSMQKSEVMVTLCKECGKAGARFRELFVQLDKIHLEMRYFLGGFQAGIIGSDENPELLGEFCKRMTGDIGSMVHLGIVNELRREMLQKCTAITSNNSPRIEISSRLSLDHVQREIKAPLTTPTVTPSKSSVGERIELFCSTRRRSERVVKKEKCPISPVAGPSREVHTTITLDSDDSFQNDEDNTKPSSMEQGTGETTHSAAEPSTSAAAGLSSSTIATEGSAIVSPSSQVMVPPPASTTLPVTGNSEENPAMPNEVRTTISPATSSGSRSLFIRLPKKKCQTCGILFSTMSELASHRKCAHSKVGQLETKQVPETRSRAKTVRKKRKRLGFTHHKTHRGVKPGTGTRRK